MSDAEEIAKINMKHAAYVEGARAVRRFYGPDPQLFYGYVCNAEFDEMAWTCHGMGLEGVAHSKEEALSKWEALRDSAAWRNVAVGK